MAALVSPAPGDETVFKGGALSSAFFTGQIQAWRREPATTAGFEWVCLEFEGGGSVQILTGNPLVWIEPERH